MVIDDSTVTENPVIKVIIWEIMLSVMLLLAAHYLEPAVLPLTAVCFVFTLWQHLKLYDQPAYNVIHLSYLIISGVFGFFFARIGININFIFYGITGIAIFNQIRINHPVVILTLLTISFIFVNTVANEYTTFSSSGDNSSVLAILFPLTLLIFIVNTVNKYNQLQVLYLSAFLAICISSFDFLLAYLNGPLYIETEITNITNDNVIKVSGVSNQVNQLANYIAYITPITIWMIPLFVNKFRKLGYSLLGLLLLLLIFMSSRSGVALVVIYFISLILFSGNKIGSRSKLILTLLLSSITYIVITYELPIFKKITMKGETGDEIRLAKVNEALSVFDENPLLGVGLNNYTTLAEAKFGNNFNTHNTLLSVLAEQGLVGIILFSILFIMPVIRYATQKKYYSKNVMEMNNAIMLSYFLIFMSFFTDHLHGNSTYYILLAAAIQSTSLSAFETTDKV